MKRRTVLQSALAGATALATPSLVRAQSQTTLRFVPQADLAGATSPILQGRKD